MDGSFEFEWRRANRNALPLHRSAVVQAILLVRDDSWMATSRLFRELESRLVEGRNVAAVDLLDVQHARRVLMAFGRAHQRLPNRPEELSAVQQEFLKQGIEHMAHEGKVIPVRLSLFVEIVKTKPWTPETLRSFGGGERIGLEFLKQTFASVVRRGQQSFGRHEQQDQDDETPSLRLPGSGILQTQDPRYP